MKFRFAALNKVRSNELIGVFNSAFTEYFVKIELNEQSFSNKILSENIDLEKSVGAFFNNKLVGFILIGTEKGIAYNGGTGVLPEFRGNLLSRKMYGFILPKLKLENIHSHQLEVITENFPAIKTYEKTGFKIVRTLVCFKGKISVSKVNEEIEIKILEDIDENLFPTFWNSQPSWQNSLSAIERTKKLHKIIGAFCKNKLVGYLIYTENGRVKQFAVNKDFRRLGIGQTLFSQLNNKEIVITNIDKDDTETVSFLNKIGLNPFLEQFEMKLKI